MYNFSSLWIALKYLFMYILYMLRLCVYSNQKDDHSFDELNHNPGFFLGGLRGGIPPTPPHPRALAIFLLNFFSII